MDKFEVKKPLGMIEHRWEDNLIVDLKLGIVVWTGFIWLRIQSSCRLL
jgi:hypothetical protein